MRSLAPSSALLLSSHSHRPWSSLNSLFLSQTLTPPPLGHCFTTPPFAAPSRFPSFSSMLQSLMRPQQRLLAQAQRQSRSLLSAVHTNHAALAASSTPAAALSSSSPASLQSLSHSFSTDAAPAVSRKSGKKAAAAAAAAAAGPADLLGPSEYDEFNRIPAIPKQKKDDLDVICLTEEQLRFARRPMPSSAHRQELLPSIYIGSKPISQHTQQDFGKYYHVEESVMKTIPPTIHRSMSQEYMGGGPFHMVRNPGWDIVQELKAIQEKGVKGRDQRVFGVRGSSGCGKSAALHYVAQFLREESAANPSKPWLLVATRAEEFTTETKGFIAPSTVKPGVFDQALYTMEYMKNLLKTESEALKKIALKRHRKYEDLQWGEGAAKGTTLFDLVTLASTDRAQAPRLLYDFTAELKRATEIPVLVMMDNMNVWDQVCEFVEPFTYEKMDPRKLALVDAFSWFATKPPGNGASVWALTTKHATLQKTFRHFTFPSIVGKDSFWYSAQELKHCVVHYSVSEFILSEVNQELLVRINGLTGKVPRDVFKQAFLR